MTQLGEVLKANNLSHTELARRLGISRGAVSLMVKQGITTMRTAKKYANAIGVTAIFLLENDSNN